MVTLDGRLHPQLDARTVLDAVRVGIQSRRRANRAGTQCAEGLRGCSRPREERRDLGVVHQVARYR